MVKRKTAQKNNNVTLWSDPVAPFWMAKQKSKSV